MAALVFPDSPSDQETFTAPNDVIYTYSSVNDSWTGDVPLSVFIDPDPSDVSATPDFDSGTGSFSDPFVITPAIVALGESASSAQYITIADQTQKYVRFFNATKPSATGSKFNQSFATVNSDGEWQGRLVYDDSKGIITEDEFTITGTLIIGTVYFSWTVTQLA